MSKHKLVSVLLIIFFSTSLYSDTINDYAYQIIVKPNGDSALQKINLTSEIYFYSKHNNLGDIQVFDSNGLQMPFEIGEVNTNHTKKIEKEIKSYPLFEKQFLSDQTENIYLSYNTENQLGHIKKSQIEKSEMLVVGYILDLAEQHETKLSELEFVLSEVSETSFLHFNIDQSDDLKSWSRLSSNEVLAQLFHNQDLAVKNVVKLSGKLTRYLRISITDQAPKFEILKVKLNYALTEHEEVITWQSLNFFKENGDDFLVATVSPSIPMQYLKFELTNPVPYFRGLLSYKHKTQMKHKNQLQWKNYRDISFYKVNDGSNELVQNQVELDGLKTTHLKLKLDNPKAENDVIDLKAQIGWKAQSLVFLAAGEAPYFIVTGSELPLSHVQQNVQRNISNNKIIADIKKKIEKPIPDAVIIGSKINKQKVAVELLTINWSKGLLWLVLFLGVGLMCWMARGLLKQITKED